MTDLIVLLFFYVALRSIEELMRGMWQEQKETERLIEKHADALKPGQTRR